MECRDFFGRGESVGKLMGYGISSSKVINFCNWNLWDTGYLGEQFKGCRIIRRLLLLPPPPPNYYSKLILFPYFTLSISMTGVGGRPEVIIEGSNDLEGPWMVEIKFLFVYLTFMCHRNVCNIHKEKNPETLGSRGTIKMSSRHASSKEIRTVLCDCVGLADDIKKTVVLKFFTFYIS